MRIEETIQGGILIKNIIYEDSDIRTQEQKDILFDICDICEFKQGDNCGECGCLLEMRMFYNNINCPINKW